MDRDFKSKNKIAQKTCAGEAYLKVVIAKLRALKRHRAQECDFMQNKVRLRWGSTDGMISPRCIFKANSQKKYCPGN